MRNVSLIRRRDVLLLAVAAALLGGCGETPAFDATSFDELGLSEVGAVYRGFTKKNQRPPRAAKEIASLEQGFPTALEKIRTGEVVVFWGAPMSSEGDASRTVLAYARATPTLGGPVLMQDGQTIKKLTAQEFEAAPKAPGNPAPEKPRGK
jgi:hypothetical protein